MNDDEFDLKEVMGADSLEPQDLLDAVIEQIAEVRRTKRLIRPQDLNRWELLLRSARSQLK